MAYGARHMFYILFDVVLLTSTVAGVQPLSDMHVSGTFGALMFSSCTVGFYLSYLVVVSNNLLVTLVTQKIVVDRPL